MALHHRVIAASTSGQSHLIVAAVLMSFFVWITLQGHLRVYLNALGFGTPPAAQAGQAAAGTIANGLTGSGGIGGALGGLIPGIPGVPSLPSIPGLGQ